jgi:hypothetical protein
LGTWGIGRICGEGRAEFVLLGRRNPQPGNFTAQDLISNPYFIITEGQEKPYTARKPEEKLTWQTEEDETNLWGLAINPFRMRFSLRACATRLDSRQTPKKRPNFCSLPHYTKTNQPHAKHEVSSSHQTLTAGRAPPGGSSSAKLPPAGNPQAEGCCLAAI